MIITTRQLEILRMLAEGWDRMAADEDYAENDYEIAWEGRQALIGYEPIAPRSIFCLLRYGAIRDVSDRGNGIDGGKGLRRYQINDTGRAIIQRPDLAGEVMAAFALRKPFSIKENRVVFDK